MAVHIEGQGREIYKGTYGKDIRGPISDALWILYNHGLQATTKMLMTQEEYDALEIKDPNVAYCIYDPTEPVWKDYWISVIMLDGDADTDDIFYCKTLAEARAKLDEYYENDPDAMYRIWIGEECGVASIPKKTFQSCHNMLAFHVPGTVSVIDADSFSDSLLHIVTFGQSSKPLYIYNHAFANTNLKTVDIPDRCLYAGEIGGGSQFRDNQLLESVKFGNSLSTISESMFSGCIKLYRVQLPDSITTIKYGGFEHCRELSEIDINNVTSIGEYAFAGCGNLAEVVLENVQTISSYAFYSCIKLTRVEFAQLTAPLGSYSFYNCRSLHTVVFHPGAMYSIAEGTFMYCVNLETIVLQNDPNCISIGDKAFSYCEKLSSIQLPDSVQSIGDNAFFNCKTLSRIELSPGLGTIGNDAFAFCESLDDIILPISLSDIGDYAFAYCSSLQSLELPRFLRSIPNGMCSGCRSLKTALIPSSVDKIGAEAFRGCESLKQITIPSGPTYIGDRAFMFCTALEVIVIGKDISQIMDNPTNGYLNWGVFSVCQSLRKIIIKREQDSIVDANGNIWTPKLYHKPMTYAPYIPENCEVLWIGEDGVYDL